MYDEDMVRPIPFLFVLGLALLVVFPRILNLDAFRSPDEDRWMANTNGFITKLAEGRLDELVQLPHPGITTQWLGALTIRYDDVATKKLPLVISQSLLILLAGYVFSRLWSTPAGLFVVLTLATNPLLYAHTRVYAMDSLLALFSLLALGFLLLWHKEKQTTPATYYLITSAFCTAAAILSKLPGVALLPIIASALLYWSWREKKLLGGAWLLAFLGSLVIILPSFAITPQNVIGDFAEFFRSDDYQELHQLGPWYYVRTLVFFSTPVQWAALIVLACLAIKRRIARVSVDQLIILLGFAVLLVIQMTLGAKKGDRYILPSFVALDIVSAFVISKMYQLLKAVFRGKNQKVRIKNVGVRKQYLLASCFLILTSCIAWQYVIIWRTHPHTLAYINPLTKSSYGERRLGWGEGLDLAAQYLNQKNNAAELKVATFYPNEFAPYFKGETVPIHQHDNPNVKYVVLYRAMFEREPNAWETDVVNQYRSQNPEHIISFQDVPFVWLYATATNTEKSPE